MVLFLLNFQNVQPASKFPQILAANVADHPERIGITEIQTLLACPFGAQWCE